MDPSDPGQGQETSPEQVCDQSFSSRGRQRKKNPKYFDFETDEVNDEQQKTSQRSPRGSGRGRATSDKNLVKDGGAEETTEQTVDGGNETTPQEPDEKDSQETPIKAVRAKRTPRKTTPARKTPAKKTPAKTTPARKTPAKRTPAKNTPATKTPSINGDLQAEEVGAVDVGQQENGKPELVIETPKPKRKYVRRKPVMEPVEEPPCEEAQKEAEEEIEPGGRQRRGAAKAALKYLHILAKEVLNLPSEESGSQPETNTDQKNLQGNEGPEEPVRRGWKRKRRGSDTGEDEDFVPDAEEQEIEEAQEEEDDEEEEEAEDSDLDLDYRKGGRSPGAYYCQKGSNPKTTNGLGTNIMRIIWESTDSTKKFREEHYSNWVFPEWVPSIGDWQLVPQSDLEKYLPQELQSAAFKVSREGLNQEETPPQRLDRFSSIPAHPDRWDMLLFAGGPVWAMAWCPTPDGATASQFIALSCHRGMDEMHYVNKTYEGVGLVQLWDVGTLEYDSRPDSQPSLSYGLAQDKGFIWDLKWCPAGGWEPPSCDRKAPFLPRLGLLAVASSTGVVTIYSLPHPKALLSNRTPPNPAETPDQQLPIYQAQEVLTLKLGSFRAPRHEGSGQVLSMDWLPEKPHNIMAIGFYDGVVGLWDLTTKSTLLRVREADDSLTLLPYRCLLAHDHAVRALSFCPASKYLLVTAGEDRFVKTWDLRRLHEPVTVQKRHLTNEIYWPLNAPGNLMAQEATYAASGNHGVHFFDHVMRSIYAVPRTGTLWSISYSEWLNSVLTSDVLGDVVFALLPHISSTPQHIKRTIQRRFPVSLTSLVPYEPLEGETLNVGGVEVLVEEMEEEEEEGEGGDGGEEQDHRTESPDAGSEGGKENGNRKNGGRGRKEKGSRLQFVKYKDAVKRHCIQHIDSDMGKFTGFENRTLWKRMKNTESKQKVNMDEMPLAALHKMRFNPNMCCHTWLACGGQAGLVRLNCLRGMVNTRTKTTISKTRVQFNALYSSNKDPEEAPQTETEEL